MGVRDVDRGAKALFARLRGLKEGARITVGVHPDDGAEKHPSGGTVGEVASLLELGTDKRRPLGFLRTTIAAERSTLARRLADAGAETLRRAGGQAETFGPVARDLADKVRAKVPVDTGTVAEAVEARVNGVKV